MTNRYQTLDVSLNLNNSQLNNNSPKKFANTIDFGDKSQLSNIGENDQRVNKFRQLYFKNEKLRKQLKLLNVRLNEKLQKVKLMPSKKKKAMSVDLNVPKPTKALTRQLQNAYSQVAMYKKQIATLKIKQESETTYQKFKTLQNQISYRDIQITQVQAQLKSIKNVKKLQDRTLVQDLQNEDLKQKLRQYERQFKQGQQKLKQIAKKARKRQQQYKKQQAYQVMLQKKLRKGNNQEQNEQQAALILASKNKNEATKPQLTQVQFKQVKDQIIKFKTQNQALQKKIDYNKKYVRDLKKTRSQCQQKWRQSDIQVKGINLKIESYKRMIKDGQKKNSEQQLTTYGATKHKLNPSSINQIQLESEDPSQDGDQIDNQSQFAKHKIPFQMSQVASTIKGERQWKGKPRKVTFGFMDSNDTMHKLSGSLKGMKAFIDQNIICGLTFTYHDGYSERQSQIFGTKSNIELKWNLESNDKLVKIEGSLTQQGYLAQLILITSNGLTAKFGNQGSIDKFIMKIDKNQQISGFYCAVRKLGQDTRITQLGFWLIAKNQ